MRRVVCFSWMALFVVAGACSDADDAAESVNTPATEATATPSTSQTATTATSLSTTSSTLPPSTRDRRSDVADLAQAIDARRLVTQVDDQIHLSADGQVTVIDSDNDAWVWSDGQFVYWSTATDTGDGGYESRTVARAFDGETVCQLPEPIHHVTERSTGGYVAAVERDLDEGPADDALVGYPAFAVDCATGDEQPIEPLRFVGGETGTTSVIRVGGRTFTALGDAEGNADVANEDGISINGDDYAGYHAFNADGSLVVYGEMSEGVHVSDEIVCRDTVTGDELWRTMLELPFGYLGFIGDQVIAEQPVEFAGTEWAGTASVVIIDARSGQTQASIATTLKVLHAS
ncbi:MAG: hypothetical protein R2733_17620 [Acidimicrobiales bacterium]